MNEIEALKAIIRKYEGCKLKAYYCPAGVLTIGWGATGKGITPTTVWTQQQADERLHSDAIRVLVSTKKVVPNASGGFLVALADFSYNLGLGRLLASTLRKRALENDLSGCAKELKKWVYAGGKKLDGLVKRRNTEISLFL